MLNEQRGCACTECVAACKRQPGGLRPDDVSPIAKFLGISEAELVQRYLVIDYYVTEDKNEEFLRPAKVEPDTQVPIEGGMPGRKVSFGWSWESAPCIFLTKENLCAIHEVKPWNCRVVLVCNRLDDEATKLGYPSGTSLNKALAEAWNGIDIRKRFGLNGKS